MSRWSLGLPAVASALGFAGLIAAAQSSAWGASTQLLVYTGEGGADWGYANLGQAAGREVVISTSLPADVSAYSCVVLSTNFAGSSNGAAFSSATVAALASYLATGGRVLVLSENAGFPNNIAAVNGLTAALGSTITVEGNYLSSPTGATTEVGPAAAANGVSSLAFMSSSAVHPGGSGLSVARVFGTTFVASQQIGSGLLVVSGDSNVLSDESDGYAAHDNGTLARNVCGDPVVLPTATPTSTAVSTPTSVPTTAPTSTPEPTATATPTATPTHTATATATPTATPTSPNRPTPTATTPPSRPPTAVALDIKPGDRLNTINRAARGLVPVALLGSVEFDAGLIEPDSVCFAGDCTEAHHRGHIEDANGDGLPDLVLHFDADELTLRAGAVEACATGALKDGRTFRSCDSVRILR